MMNKQETTPFNAVSGIMDYEDGQMNNEEMVEFFAKLVKTGMAWSLQGSYGRTAVHLIEGGYISKDGDVLKYPEMD
jgi:hypothetical protein